METTTEENVGINHLLPLLDLKVTLHKLCLGVAIASVRGHFRLIGPLSRKLSIRRELQEIDIDEGRESAGFHAVWLEPFVNESQQGKSIFLR